MRITAHQKQDEPELIEAPPGLYEELIIKSVLIRVFSHIYAPVSALFCGENITACFLFGSFDFFAAKIICF